MQKTVTAVALALAAGLAWWWLSSADLASGPDRQRPPAVVTTWELTRGEFTDEVSALGSLRAWESVVITASVAETVTEVHFLDGERVEKGDILITLRQDEEQAALREQQENLADAEREVARLENLAKRNQVAQTELDSVRTRAAIARHKISEMRARIADRNITAPFAGQLGLREVSPGALVTPGQQITTLDDKTRMRMDFAFSTSFIAFVEPAQLITAHTPAYDRSFTGTVSAVDSRVDTVSRSVTARAILPNDEGLLKPGMLMEVRLLGGKRSALLLPEESLQSRAANHFVWKMDGDTARRTEVSIGARRPGWVEVVSGLSAGDQVVRDGVSKLRGTEATVRVVAS